MHNLSRDTCLLTEFYNRHRSLIDALAKDDEMFRAVKEIAEIEGAAVGEDLIKSFGGNEKCPL